MAEMENGVKKEEAVLTYAEAFPPLCSFSPTERDSTPQTSGAESQWGSSKYAIPTSTVTQVKPAQLLT